MTQAASIKAACFSSCLTVSERAAKALAYGKRNHEISAILCITEGTTKTHIHHIIQKLGAQDRTQAVVTAIRMKLVK